MHAMYAQLPGLPAQVGTDTATAWKTGRKAQKPTSFQVSALLLPARLAQHRHGAPIGSPWASSLGITDQGEENTGAL